MEIYAPNESLKLLAFHLLEELSPTLNGDLPLYLSVQRTDNGFFAEARHAEQTMNATAFFSDHFTEKRTENVACAKAVYDLLSPHAKEHVPYGTLVGVRPVKIALFYLEHGLGTEVVCKRLKDDYYINEEKARLLCNLALLERGAQSSLKDHDALLYLSIPFCPSRCRYCSFVSHSAPKQLSLLNNYLSRMNEELEQIAGLFVETGRRLRCVYLGGGTPGLLSAEQLEEIFKAIQNRFPLAETVEYTAELGRPDTITFEKCQALTACGVGRICINPQTLSDSVLQENMRNHTVQDFYEAFFSARKAGISVINTDLIAGLVSDTADGFTNSVEKILALAPENLTIHALCKKRASEETRSFHEDKGHRFRDAMKLANERCINQGYQPYYLYRQKHTIANLENLGYAKEGTACLYNIAMMEDLCDVFSVGAGAMTKLKRMTTDGYRMIRLPSYKYPAEYLTDPQKGIRNLALMRQILTEKTQ